MSKLYKTIAVDLELYNLISKRKQQNNRTILGQLKHDLETLEQLDNI